MQGSTVDEFFFENLQRNLTLLKMYAPNNKDTRAC